MKEENVNKIKNLLKVHLTEIEELQSQNHRIEIVLEQTLQEHKITLADKADSYERLSEDMKKSCNDKLKDANVKEVNELKTLNEELEKRVAASELSNIALTKKKEELVQEVINMVNKANDQRGKIKIEYDKLVKAVAERDTRITLQEQHIQELKLLLL